MFPRFQYGIIIYRECDSYLMKELQDDERTVIRDQSDDNMTESYVSIINERRVKSK